MNLLPWVLLAIGVLLIVVFFTGSQSLIKLYQLKEQEAHLRKLRQSYIQQNDSLEQEIHRLKNDVEYQEKVAREKFNMKKKGEEVYIVEPR